MSKHLLLTTALLLWAASSVAQTTLYDEGFDGQDPDNTGFQMNGQWYLPATGGNGENNDESVRSYGPGLGTADVTNPFASDALLVGNANDTITTQVETGISFTFMPEFLYTFILDWAVVTPTSNPAAIDANLRLNVPFGGVIDIAALQGSPVAPGIYSTQVDRQVTSSTTQALDFRLVRAGSTARNQVFVDRLQLIETPLTDIVITAIVSATTATPGDTLEYLIRVENLSGNTAENLILNIPPLPQLESFAAPAPCAGGFPCALGDLASGAFVEFTVTSTVDPNLSASSTATLLASISSTTREIGAATSNNSATVSTLITVLNAGNASAVPVQPAFYTLLMGLLLIGLGRHYRQRHQ